MLKMHKTAVIFALCLTVFFCSFGVNALAYNSDYLDDTSWVDDGSTITKNISYDSDNGIMDCAVSYLVDENNSTAYFQVLANNFGITSKSDIRLYFEILADNQRYNFYVDKSGLQSTDDYGKLFAAKSNFTSTKNVGSGTYIAALDIKTKANVNKIHISITIDSKKYDLIDGILMNAVTTTKKPTSTRPKTTAQSRTTTQKSAANAAQVTVEIEKSTTKKSKKSSSKSTGTTKFVGKNKYHTTVKSESESKFSATGTTAQADTEQQNTTQVEWHTYNKNQYHSTKNTVFTIIGAALGVVALLLIGIAIGKASNKKEAKKEAEKEESAVSPDDAKINDDDDFEF